MQAHLSAICDACCSAVHRGEGVTIWDCQLCGSFCCEEMVVFQPTGISMTGGKRYCAVCDAAVRHAAAEKEQLL